MYNKENKRRREPWEMSFLTVKEKKYTYKKYTNVRVFAK